MNKDRIICGIIFYLSAIGFAVWQQWYLNSLPLNAVIGGWEITPETQRGFVFVDIAILCVMLGSLLGIFLSRSHKKGGQSGRKDASQSAPLG